MSFVRVVVGSLVATAVCLHGAYGNADDGGKGVIDLTVHVGSTVTADVGYARGLTCDDVNIIHVELRSENPTTNRFYVTGVHPGTTLCRVGLDFPTHLFHVTVIP